MVDERSNLREASRSKRLVQCAWIGAVLALTGCVTPAPVSTSAPALSDADGYTGRVRLTRFLDEPDGYCLDVPGPAQAVMLQFPLVAHTCHPDPYADQVFQFNTDGTGQIRWTTSEHDLCFTADAAEPNSVLNLRSCDQPALQGFSYIAPGQLQLTGSDLCIQVERTGPAMRDPVGEGQDAYGRGRSVNPQYTHLMRQLRLLPCGDGDPAMSRWMAIE